MRIAITTQDGRYFLALSRARLADAPVFPISAVSRRSRSREKRVDRLISPHLGASNPPGLPVSDVCRIGRAGGGGLLCTPPSDPRRVAAGNRSAPPLSEKLLPRSQGARLAAARSDDYDRLSFRNPPTTGINPPPPPALLPSPMILPNDDSHIVILYSDSELL